MVNEKIPEPRWEALKGFTSEKYKEFRRKRDAEIDRMYKILRNKERLRRLLVLTQSASIIAIIALLAAVFVLL